MTCDTHSITAASRAEIIRLGGISSLATLLQSPYSELQQKAVWALGCFCHADDQVQNILAITPNAVPSLLSLLQSPSDEVLRYSVTVTAIIAGHPLCAAEIRKHDGFKILVVIRMYCTLMIASCHYWLPRRSLFSGAQHWHWGISLIKSTAQFLYASHKQALCNC